jgi:hypothetical protein
MQFALPLAYKRKTNSLAAKGEDRSRDTTLPVLTLQFSHNIFSNIFTRDLGATLPLPHCL